MGASLGVNGRRRDIWIKASRIDRAVCWLLVGSVVMSICMIFGAVDIARYAIHFANYIAARLAAH